MNKQPPKSETEEPRRPFTTREEPAYQAYQTHKPSTPAGTAVGTLIYDNRDAEQPINEYEVSNVNVVEEVETTRPLTPTTPSPPTNTNTNIITNIITNNEPVTSKTPPPPPLDYKQMIFDFNFIPVFIHIRMMMITMMIFLWRHKWSESKKKSSTMSSN